MITKRFPSLCAAASLAIVGALAAPQQAGAVVAYEVPAGTVGNQAFGGALGMDFDVLHSVVVKELGVFDSSSNGLSSPITARLWNRANTVTPLESITFAAGPTGTLVDGSRFLPLATPRILPFGFQGTIAAGGYSGAEPNGNQGIGGLGLTTNSGGGLLSFVGGGRFEGGGNPINYPLNGDGGPANRYAAGTFTFESANIAYEVASGLDGDQAFGGALGMDFQANQATAITHLGVFDDDSNGIAPGTTITAQLYLRNENGTPLNFGDDTGTLLAQVNFVAGNDGELIGGSRFKPLSDATLFNGFNGILPAGANATIVASGYGVLEENGNVGTLGSRTTFDGFGQISFEGLGRYDFAGNVFPGILDGGPANRYAAGTFRFAQVVILPEPATMSLLILGGAGLLARRRRAA